MVICNTPSLSRCLSHNIKFLSVFDDFQLFATNFLLALFHINVLAAAVKWFDRGGIFRIDAFAFQYFLYRFDEYFQV